MFLEPNMLGHEGVGLMGWCPVSWLSPGVEGRALDTAPRLPASTHARCSRSLQENPPVHTWTGIPLTLVFAFSSGGPPCSLPPARRVLAFVGITAFESVEIELGPGLPDPRVPTQLWRPFPLWLPGSQWSDQHFQVGPASACPLPYAVYFLELTLVTSHVALATEQLLCPQQPTS